MRFRLSSSLLALGCLAFAGCGLKGPLYLPEEKAQQSQRDDEKKERAKDSSAPAPAPTETSPSAPTTPPPRS